MDKIKKVKIKNGRLIFIYHFDGIDKDVFFEDYAASKIRAEIGEMKEGVEYETNHKIYVANHSPTCSGLWPNTNHYECGGIGILATI